MKSIHIVSNVRDAVIVDHSTNTVKGLKPIRSDIDRIYSAPEDMQICYTNNNNERVTLEAKKGDIIVTFYDYDYIVNKVIVVKNTKWKENLISKQCDEENQQNKLVKMSFLRSRRDICEDCDECKITDC